MRRSEAEYDWMEGKKHQSRRRALELKPAFLRKPYAGTSAETKDNTQQELHEYDYLK